MRCVRGMLVMGFLAATLAGLAPAQATDTTEPPTDEVCDMDASAFMYSLQYGSTWQEYAIARTYPGPDNECELQWYYAKILRLACSGCSQTQVAYDSDRGGLDPQDGFAEASYSRNCGLLPLCSGYRTHHWSSFYSPPIVKSLGLW